MTTTLDRFGRIVIPGALRNKLGLLPGTEVELTDEGSSLQLRAVRESGRLVKKHGLICIEGLTWTGDADIVGLLRTQREQHASQTGGLA
jgi:AbrB family looped-hinge helix DNA binding protein